MKRSRRFATLAVFLLSLALLVPATAPAAWVDGGFYTSTQHGDPFLTDIRYLGIEAGRGEHSIIRSFQAIVPIKCVSPGSPNRRVVGDEGFSKWGQWPVDEHGRVEFQLPSLDTGQQAHILVILYGRTAQVHVVVHPYQQGGDSCSISSSGFAYKAGSW